MLICQDITFSYSSRNSLIKKAVLDNFNLMVNQGEFIGIVGNSGVGKTTVCKIIAGLLKPTKGIITFNSQAINSPHIERGLIFQDPALFDWLTVEENIHFGPKLQKDDEKETCERTKHLLNKIGLWDKRKQYPHELSGGEKQRVALARAVINQPKLLLLDEPFSALDCMIRRKMGELLLAIWSEYKFTTILITHDIEEVVSLSDKIVVLESPTQQSHFDVTIKRPRVISSQSVQEIRFKIEDKITRAVGEHFSL